MLFFQRENPQLKKIKYNGIKKESETKNMNKENFIQLIESARLHHINLDYSGLKQEERDSLLRLEKDIAKTFADSNEDEMLILRFIENGNICPIRMVNNHPYRAFVAIFNITKD